MRVLHYLSGFRREYGGPVESVIQLSEALTSIGHTVSVVSKDLTDVPLGWRSGEGVGPMAYRLQSPWRRVTWAGTNHPLSQLVAESDIVHVHSLWDLGAVRIGRLAEHMGVPYILSTRGCLDGWSLEQKRAKKLVFLKAYGCRLIRAAAGVHCTAEAEWAQVQQFVRDGHSIVLPNPIDLRKFLPARRVHPTSLPQIPVVLFFSRLHPQKGAEYLLRAVAQLRARGMLLRVVVAGAGEPEYEQSLKNLCDALGITEEVAFVGPVWGDGRAKLYQESDIFVLPTSSENFGRVLFEALACGTVVVTTKGVDTADQLVESGGAVIVGQDAGELAVAIERLLTDETLRRQMSLRGSTWVHARLDGAVLAQAYAQAYSNVIMTH